MGCVGILLVYRISNDSGTRLNSPIPWPLTPKMREGEHRRRRHKPLPHYRRYAAGGRGGALAPGWGKLSRYRSMAKGYRFIAHYSGRVKRSS